MQLETRFQRFSFGNFSKPCLTLPSLVNSRWRTVGDGKRYQHDVSGYTTQFSGMPDPLPLVPTSSDFGEQHQLQEGSNL